MAMQIYRYRSFLIVGSPGLGIHLHVERRWSVMVSQGPADEAQITEYRVLRLKRCLIWILVTPQSRDHLLPASVLYTWQYYTQKVR